MKTLSKLLFLLAFVSIVSGCSKQDEICDENSAGLQLKSADNRTIPVQLEPGQGTAWVEVFCDGEPVDYLVGDGNTISAFARYKYEDGKLVRMLITCKGTMHSIYTGNIYTFTEQDKLFLDENENIIAWRATCNYKGEEGLHYITVWMLVDPVAGTWEITKAMCVPNADNKDL